LQPGADRFARRPGFNKRIIDRVAAMRIIVAINRLPSRGGSGVTGWFMGPSETIYIDEMVAACNGGGGPLGHPRVYLNLAPVGRVECPYCSRLYVNRAMAGSGAPAGPTVSTAMDPPHDQPNSATSE
jgi:uncharacterized Zn-finger protein